MTEIQLGYGKGSLTFEFDADHYELLDPNSLVERPFTDVEIGAALNVPIESPPLEDLFAAGDSVLLVVSDATRATASAQVLHLLVRRLIQAGVSPAEIGIVFATGIHRPVTPEEKVALLTPFIAQRIRTIDHNAADDAAMISLGTTGRGTPVAVNRALRDFSQVVITGAIGFHYFAGFTGGRKSLCPGLAAAQTIEATHMLAMDFETGGRRAGVGPGLLAGNPVHEECERVAALIEPRFCVNSVVDERGRAVKIYAGHWRAAHRQGCEEYLASRSRVIERKRPVVIVSCGGSPYDINLIQAHKALDMAAQACSEGGTIILLAQCPDGLGRPAFLKWFDEKDSSALALRLRHAYEVNGQTAWSLLTKAERFRIFLVSDLPSETVRRMRLIPAQSLAAAIAASDQGSDGYIMRRGSALLPRVQQPGS